MPVTDWGSSTEREYKDLEGRKGMDSDLVLNKLRAL